MDIAHFLALAEEEANEPQDVKGKMTAIPARTVQSFENPFSGFKLNAARG